VRKSCSVGLVHPSHTLRGHSCTTEQYFSTPPPTPVRSGSRTLAHRTGHQLGPRSTPAQRNASSTAARQRRVSECSLWHARHPPPVPATKPELLGPLAAQAVPGWAVARAALAVPGPLAALAVRGPLAALAVRGPLPALAVPGWAVARAALAVPGPLAAPAVRGPLAALAVRGPLPALAVRGLPVSPALPGRPVAPPGRPAPAVRA